MNGLRCVTILAAGLVLPLTAQQAQQRSVDAETAAFAELGAALDAAFEDCDLDAYEACFRPVHLQRHATHIDRIGRILQSGVRLERDTEELDHWRLGAHRISLAKVTTRSRLRPGHPAVVEHLLLASAPAADDRLVATLLVEVDERFLAAMSSANALAPKSLLSCTACNYRIDGGVDWLTVPNRKERTGCLEGLSFYALDAEVTVDLAVHMAREGSMPKPALLLKRLAIDVLHAPDLELTIEPWLPPLYTERRPRMLHGARSVVDEQDLDRRTELHLACYGRLGYLFVVRGRTAAVGARREAIDALLESFVLLEPDADPATVEARILEQRLGGSVDGTRYVNGRYRLVVDGVPGWTPTLTTADDAFDVVWRCPQRLGMLRCQAFTPPRGLDAWTQRAADAMLARALRGDATRVETDTRWTRDETGSGFAWTRALRIDRPSRELDTELRVYLDGDLLMILEGQPFDERSRPDVLMALERVRRD